MNYKYALFDLDGTLLNTQKLWDKYERELIGEHFGIDMYFDESNNEIPFTGFSDMFKKAEERSGKTGDKTAVFDKLYKQMATVYETFDIEIKQNALEFLKHLKENGVKTALTTATPIYLCKSALDRLGLAEYLDELVCTDDVGKTKYYPDVYDRALKLLDGTKEEALVFEDSLYCAKTLKSSSYRCVAIFDECSEKYKEELKNICDRYITSFDEMIQKRIDTEKTANLLSSCEKIAVGIHQNADGDCYGSACALCSALKKLGKECVILSPDNIPQRLTFLNGENIKLICTKQEYEKEDLSSFTFITVDVASCQLLGELESVFFKHNNYLAVDHHKISTVDSRFLCLDENASAAGEIIYEIICNLEKITGTKLFDKNIADNIFGAISSDSGCFKYSNTTPKTHIIASLLLSMGADGALINYKLFDLKTSVQIAVEALAYQSIQYYENGKIAFIYLSDESLEKAGATQDDAQTVPQLARSIEGVQIGVFMKQKGDGKFKFSVRSNNECDMADLCQKVGMGGGHKKAAGCTVSAKDEIEAREIFLKIAKEYLE